MLGIWLKHVWFSGLQYIQGVRSAREKFGKVALKKITSLHNKENKDFYSNLTTFFLLMCFKFPLFLLKPVRHMSVLARCLLF